MRQRRSPTTTEGGVGPGTWSPMDTRMAQPAAWTAGESAAVAAAVGACSAVVSKLIKWLKTQDGLGLPGAPSRMLPSVPLLPLGHRDIYKVLKFGVSWGRAPLPAPEVLFLFSENHSWDCRPRCWGHMPQPLHHPCCCLGRGKGGTVPVIIKHEFN